MKRIISTLIGIVLVAGILFCYLMPPQRVIIQSETPYKITSTNRDKKKILIFSSRGGGGHISVMNALYEYLDDTYLIGHSFIFTDVLSQIDPAQWVTKGNGEDFYNFCLKRKWYQCTNLMYNFGSWYYLWRQKKIQPIIEKYLQEHKPDLVISVIPLVNSIILDATTKLKIPFLLIPTDLDATIALNGIDTVSYDKFHLALSYNCPEVNEVPQKANIDPRYISYTGFPVKKAFFEPTNVRATRKSFGIPEDKPVILLLMGAQGSQDLYKFSKNIAKLQSPAHVIIVLGKSEELRSSLESIYFPPHITRTILGFTNQIPDLMKMSDLLISKSGSVSFNEAIYAHLPIILDSTSGVLKWEQLNHIFVKKYKLGESIKKIYRLPHMITDLISHKDRLEKIKENFDVFTEKNPEQEIQLLVKKILNTR